MAKFYALCLCDGKTGEKLILGSSPYLKASAVAADDYLAFAAGIVQALRRASRPQLAKDAEANGLKLTRLGTLPKEVEEFHPGDLPVGADGVLQASCGAGVDAAVPTAKIVDGVLYGEVVAE